MSPLAIRVLAALALLGAAFGGGWLVRGWKADSERLESLQADMTRMFEAQQSAVKADVALAKALKAQPKAGPRIREIVRANPSDCRVPAAVSDGLRHAIRDANAAAR